jgi:UDP-N-acetylmuramate dehydrogenase
MNLENIELNNLNIKKDFDTSKISWLKSGGKVKLYCNIKSHKHLIDIFKFINLNKISFIIVGNFSNTLIKASGFSGLLLKLSNDFTKILIKDNIVTVGASVLDSKFSIFCYENSIGGYEFLYTIPGTIGGNVFMNAGCYGYKISDKIISINIFDTLTFETKEIKVDEINFKYREGFQIKNKIILSVNMKIQYTDKDLIKSKMMDFDKQRKITQPQKVNCCGSIFKNPPHFNAWKLISTSVDKSFYIGDVKLSRKHSNFFENKAFVNPDIIESFLKKIENKVLIKHNIKLEKELRIVGD